MAFVKQLKINMIMLFFSLFLRDKNGESLRFET